MSGKEHGPGQGRHEESLRPFALPGELAAFLAGEEYAMVTNASNQGTVYVVKMPARDITSLAGRIPVAVRHELHQHALAPVIRTVARFYDQPERPLALESFINVADEQQWAEFAQLAEQDKLLFLVYDETLTHRLTKAVGNSAQEEMARILNWADRVQRAIPEDHYDFDRAKADIIARSRL